jgi:serine/threonine protein kinase, bacterial
VNVALIAATAVILAAVGITGYLLWPHSPASQTPTAQPAPPSGQTAQPAPPPVQTVLPFTGLNSPDDVAADAAGNVYVTDYQNQRVLKLAAGSATPTALPFTGLNGPGGVAVDTAANVYVTEDANNRVL